MQVSVWPVDLDPRSATAGPSDRSMRVACSTVAGVVHIPASRVQWPILPSSLTVFVATISMTATLAEARRDLSVIWFGFI